MTRKWNIEWNERPYVRLNDQLRGDRLSVVLREGLLGVLENDFRQSNLFHLPKSPLGPRVRPVLDFSKDSPGILNAEQVSGQRCCRSVIGLKKEKGMWMNMFCEDAGDRGTFYD